MLYYRFIGVSSWSILVSSDVLVVDLERGNFEAAFRRTVQRLGCAATLLTDVSGYTYDIAELVTDTQNGAASIQQLRMMLTVAVIARCRSVDGPARANLMVETDHEIAIESHREILLDAERQTRTSVAGESHFLLHPQTEL